MTRQIDIPRRISFVRITLIVLAVVSFAFTLQQRASGADLAEQAHSLRKVPADASFYSASLRFREQWHAFLGSKAYAKLMEIPVVQFGKMQISFQWQQSEEPTIAKLREYVQSSAGQDGVAVLKEMFSDECFTYGGSDITESFKMLMELNSLGRKIRMEGHASGKTPDEVATKQILEFMDKHSDTFKLPTIVFGFRIKDKARAKRELDEVHSLVRNLLDEHQPELAAHLQREQIGGHEFLTMHLDSSMLPWDKVREAAKQLDDEQFEKVKSFISKHKLSVALGVADEFVLLSFGESTDHLEKMGKGSVLTEQPAIKRLEKHADQRVVGVHYISKAFAMSLNSANKPVEDIAGAVDEGLSGAKISEEHRKKIIADIREINLRRYIPEPGDTSAVAFMTGRGYESFKYVTAKVPLLDSSKPLTILSHVGGSPMFMLASRSKQNIQDYIDAVDWLRKTAVDIEKIAEEKSEPEQWSKYQEIRKKAISLLERLDQANREYLYPALADGQGAFVLDVSAKSKQWFGKMPESPKPLPMFELALVAGVSDAEKLRQGVKTYIDVAREAYKLIKEANPKDMPKLKLPKATVSDIPEGGKIYSYPLPKEWKVDPQVAPNTGLTDKFAAVSTMPKTTDRLLQETTPGLDTILKLDRPAAMVTHVEPAKMIEAIRPWIDYGVAVATGKLKPPKEKGEDDSDKDPANEPNPALLQLGFVVPQVHQFLDFASVLRSASSVMYEEDGVWITHSETHIQDLK